MNNGVIRSPTTLLDPAIPHYVQESGVFQLENGHRRVLADPMCRWISVSAANRNNWRQNPTSKTMNERLAAHNVAAD
jgi:hypothetical protein